MTKAALRPGKREDAPVLAELVNAAGEGLPLYLWENMREGHEGAWDVGRRRAARDTGSFSYRNAIVAELEGQAVGCMISYRLPDAPEPIPQDMPAMFRPLQELENLAPGTRYVNVLAVVPAYRGRTIGSQLLKAAIENAKEEGSKGISIIVSDANVGACRLYMASGFSETAWRAMVKESWKNEGQNWLLLTASF